MKKIMILAAAMLLLSVTSARADHDRPIQFNQLPAAAQEFINTYFANEKVSFAKEERDFMEVRYEVMFTNSINRASRGDSSRADSDLRQQQFPRGKDPRHRP